MEPERAPTPAAAPAVQGPGPSCPVSRTRGGSLRGRQNSRGSGKGCQGFFQPNLESCANCAYCTLPEASRSCPGSVSKQRIKMTFRRGSGPRVSQRPGGSATDRVIRTPTVLTASQPRARGLRFLTSVSLCEKWVPPPRPTYRVIVTITCDQNRWCFSCGGDEARCVCVSEWSQPRFRRVNCSQN